MNINNCVAGDYAIVIRQSMAAAPGTIVKVNFSSRKLTELRGSKMWDVETSGGTFFYAADKDLISLSRAFEVETGFRDELFDPVWIFSDYEGGDCSMNQIGLPKRRTQPRGAR